MARQPVGSEGSRNTISVFISASIAVPTLPCIDRQCHFQAIHFQ